MTIKEKIRQRRRQMLVHSYIYYELDDNIVSDAQWAKWAKELEQLQRDYPKESAEVEEYEQFKDWDESSGAFLIFNDDIKKVAKILLDNQEVKSRTKISNPDILVPVFTKKSQNKQLKSQTRSLF